MMIKKKTRPVLLAGIGNGVNLLSNCKVIALAKVIINVKPVLRSSKRLLMQA